MKNFYDSVMGALRESVQKEFGGKNNAAARALDVKPSVLSQWLNEVRTPTLSGIGPVMDKIGVQVIPPSEKAVDYEYIPMVDAVAGAGSSYVTSGDVQGYLAFRKDYCVRRRIHSKTCITLTVSGDSMSPLLQSGDMILVDTTEKDVMSGRVYLIGLGEECLVKQLNRSPDGIVVHSINPTYPDQTIAPDLIGSYFHVHGRVKWYGRDLD